MYCSSADGVHLSLAEITNNPFLVTISHSLSNQPVE